MRPEVKEVAQAVAANGEKESVQLRRATVVTVVVKADMKVVSLTFPGSATLVGNVAVLGGYEPMSGDEIWVFQQGPMVLAIGGTGERKAAAVRANRSSNQSINDNSATAVSFTGADDFDTDAFHDTGTNPSRLTVPVGKAGYYVLVGQPSYAANTTGRRETELRKNGSGFAQIETAPMGGGVSTVVQIAGIAYFAVGDYAELFVLQTSGGSLNIQSGTWLSMVRMGP
jgi:hypothetical protein